MADPLPPVSHISCQSTSKYSCLLLISTASAFHTAGDEEEIKEKAVSRVAQAVAKAGSR